jgi:hypothetical protein
VIFYIIFHKLNLKEENSSYSLLFFKFLQSISIIISV